MKPEALLLLDVAPEAAPRVKSAAAVPLVERNLLVSHQALRPKALPLLGASPAVAPAAIPEALPP